MQSGARTRARGGGSSQATDCWRASAIMASRQIIADFTRPRARFTIFSIQTDLLLCMRMPSILKRPSSMKTFACSKSRFARYLEVEMVEGATRERRGRASLARFRPARRHRKSSSRPTGRSFRLGRHQTAIRIARPREPAARRRTEVRPSPQAAGGSGQTADLSLERGGVSSRRGGQSKLFLQQCLRRPA